MTLVPVVYMVHPVKEDVSAAGRYGEIRYVSDGYVYADELDEVLAFPALSAGGDVCLHSLPRDVRSRLESMVEVFRPRLDFLAIAGDHLQLVEAVSMLTRVHHGFNVLRFDRKANGYIAVRIGC